MSIIAFVGLPGSGKTYGVVENVILKAFRDGRHVVTNIPLHLCEVYKEFPDAQFTRIRDLETELGQREIDGEQRAPGFDNLPKGAVIILDEVWRIWPSGMKADRIAPEAKAFLAEHRHQVGPDGNTTQIVLVVQDLAQIAAFAVRLVEKTYVSRKHTELGMESRYVVHIYSGQVKGLHANQSREVGVIQGSYRPEVFRFYKSHTKSADGVVGNEQASDTRAVVWRRPLVLVGLPVSLLAAGFGWFWLFSSIDELGQDHPKSPAVSPPVTQHESVPGLIQPAAPIREPQQLLPVVTQPIAPIGPPVSSTWRLAAVIVREDGTGVVMVQSWDKHRRVPLASCKHDTEEWSCLVDGALVTAWSGPAGLQEQFAAPVTNNLSPVVIHD